MTAFFTRAPKLSAVLGRRSLAEATLNFSAMSKQHHPSKTTRGAKFWPTLGFAAITGARATSGPAFVSRYLAAGSVPPALAASPLRFLAKPGVATTLRLLLAGEVVGDKLPDAGNRIIPQQLSARALSGALVGATWYKARGGSALAGALVGSLGAAAATFATYWLRKTATEQSGLSSALTGAGEDALVLAAGRALGS